MNTNLEDMQNRLRFSGYETSGLMSSVSSPSFLTPSSPNSSDAGSSHLSQIDIYNIVNGSPRSLLSPSDLLGSDLPINLESTPSLTIIEQPVDKFRFRYKSEMMGTHGSILAKSSDKARKRTYPTVTLQNYYGEAIIRCSLYTADPNPLMRTRHTHRLVVREGNDDKDDPHEIRVSAVNRYTAIFKGMGIIHTARKHIAEELYRKKCDLKLERLRQINVNVTSLSTKEQTEIRAQAESEAKKMNLNSVSLCFEAFQECPNGVLKPICDPVFSTAINNMKSALTGELKICRIDKNTSSCSGGDEVFILVEKVGKKNIKIKFFELDDEENEIWCDYGKFSELDVHHQYAIVFRTPPYRDTEIDEKVDVFLQLYRPTDGDCSEPIRFTYKPSEKIGRKRQRTSLINENYDKYLAQDISLAKEIANLGMSGTPSFSNIETISTSLDDVRLSNNFEKFVESLSSNSDNFKEYLAALPTEAHNYSGTYLVADSVSNRPQQTSGKTSDSSVSRNSNTLTSKGSQNKSLDGAGLACQIIDEIKHNASLKKPIFTERILKMFNHKLEDGNSPLHAAVVHSQESILKDMLDFLSREPKWSLLNCMNNRWQTPLHIAAMEQPLSVKLLLNAGADPDIQDVEGNTPLHLAAKHNAHECIDELLDQSNYKSEIKADLNKKNSSGWTPLHLSIIHKNHKAVEKLVAAGACVNEVDANGRTILHLAADENDEKIATYLVEHTNIDVTKRDLSGYSALDRARAVMRDKPSPQLFFILGDNKVTGQMDTEFDLTRVKIKSDDTDDELHIDEDDEEEDEEVDSDSESDDKNFFEKKQKSHHSPDITLKSPERVDIKEEMVHSPYIKEEMVHSPLSECTIPDENGLFSAEVLTKLCDILDASGSWADLADLLDYGPLIPRIKDAHSPSKLLFHHAEASGNVTVKEIRDFLGLLDEDTAVRLLDSISNHES